MYLYHISFVNFKQHVKFTLLQISFGIVKFTNNIVNRIHLYEDCAGNYNQCYNSQYQ